MIDRAWRWLTRALLALVAVVAGLLLMGSSSAGGAVAGSAVNAADSTDSPVSSAYDGLDQHPDVRRSAQARLAPAGGASASKPHGWLAVHAPLRDAGVAAEADSGLVNLASRSRTSHILDGEVRPNGTFGGGHRPGTGFPGKSEFPAEWSDAQIMHNISDVTTAPGVPWRAGVKPGDFWANGTRDGIDIEVLIRKDQIWTGYPTNVARNP